MPIGAERIYGDGWRNYYGASPGQNGDCMTLLAKKVAGLGLVLVGGLTTAHAGSAGRAWEILAGVLLMIIGALVLSMKIVRRNTPYSGNPDH
jgi:hypothetical protein